jgi:dihydropteroate synthase
MKAAIESGVAMVNDVCALTQPGTLEVVADSNVPVCLMHMQGTPRTMQANPTYEHVLEDIKSFFEERITQCEQAGISKSRLILDPGFGFGKNTEHNVTLLNNLDQLVAMGYPILAGLSRKSLIVQVINKPADQRQAASVALAIKAWQKGASIIRVHDVAETVDALRMLNFIENFVGETS